ncbi:Band 7 protein [Schistosoma japonicum]|uniref:Band 7 protein n=1 Tax=Schistosoma japonicum TaxID=6182 RepID=A0A4Z2CTR5_SCHJA|nr:Band 7 protein [Schistosoma japonicum]
MLNKDLYPTITSGNYSSSLKTEFTVEPVDILPYNIAPTPAVFTKQWRIFFARRLSNVNNTKQQVNTEFALPVMHRLNNDTDDKNVSINVVEKKSLVNQQSHHYQQTSLSKLTDLHNRPTIQFPYMPSSYPDSQDYNDVTNHFIVLHCERILIFMSYLFLLITLPFSFLFCLRVIRHYERAVIFRLGRLILNGPTGPGLLFINPCLDVVQRVDLRTFTFDVLTQDVLTRDSVTVAVEAVVYYRIFDPVLSVVNVKNANYSTRLLAQTTLRNVLGTVDMCALLTEREHIAALMQETLDSATDVWGMKVERVEIKDVRLPLQLQRSMAAEAEATREAKAKIILALGEKEASVSLKAAALEINNCPIALQLRYLYTLNNITSGKHSTIVFPVPIELIPLMKYCSKNI